MDYLPVFLKLTHRPCLVVGGGVVAERKAGLLLRAGAAVTVVAPALTPGLESLRDSGRITHVRDAFTARLLAGMRIVVAAADSDTLNREVAHAAEDAGVLCNVVDDGGASGFIVPAIVDRSPIIVAVSTGGNAPVLAQRLKSQLEAWLPGRIDALARQAGRWRALVRRRFKSIRERRRFWQRFFDGPIAAHLLANRRREAERAFRLELIGKVVPHARQRGEAYIVGAGPGDPGLITIRGQQLLREADVVLYDRLVSRRTLDYARKDARLINVGKSPRGASVSQAAINDLLISNVRNGWRVCRLKGGDPFIFGRGGEEIRALADAGLPFQVVPGISAALGCAAYAGVPLTLRGVAGSVTFASARLDGDEEPDWRTLARDGQTLVLYMGVGSLGGTAARLVGHGLAAETPVTVVENGTTDQQRVIRGTLASIAEEAAAAGINAPATIFVGKTAGLGRELQWYEGDPAAGTDDPVPAFAPYHGSPEPGAAGRSGSS